MDDLAEEIFAPAEEISIPAEEIPAPGPSTSCLDPSRAGISSLPRLDQMSPDVEDTEPATPRYILPLPSHVPRLGTFEFSMVELSSAGLCRWEVANGI